VKLSVDGLYRLCQENIIEVKFTRRLQNVGKGTIRRMYATLDSELLNSKEGFQILRFKPPAQSPAYNAASKGLVTVWDVLFQDWRNIPANTAEVITVTPTKPLDEFWKYFNSTIRNMTDKDKANFMNS
jgi:hypothetical protein